MRFEKVKVAIRVESEAREFDFGFQCAGPKEGGLEHLGKYLGERIDAELESMFHSRETEARLRQMKRMVLEAQTKSTPQPKKPEEKVKTPRRRILRKD